MFLTLWKIKMWLGWLVASKNDRWLHSPWLYKLYQIAFRQKENKLEWMGYEKLRLKLRSSKEVLQFADPGTGNQCVRTVGEQARRTLLPRDACRFLSLLAEQLCCTGALELGTSLGITTLYLAGNQRRVVTIEGAEPVAMKAEQTFKAFPELGIRMVHSRFDAVLDLELERLKAEIMEGPILVWLDGHHQEQATQKYVQGIYGVLGQRAVVVLDDVRWSPGMYKAWKGLCQSGCWSVSIDLHRMGILIASPVLSPGKYKVRPPFTKWLSFV